MRLDSLDVFLKVRPHQYMWFVVFDATLLAFVDFFIDVRHAETHKIAHAIHGAYTKNFVKFTDLICTPL